MRHVLEKQSGASRTPDKALLPLPTQTPTPIKGVRVRKLFALFLVSSLLYLFQCPPFSWFSFPRHHPHHGKHWLFGKRAEDAFLSVKCLSLEVRGDLLNVCSVAPSRTVIKQSEHPDSLRRSLTWLVLLGILTPQRTF